MKPVTVMDVFVCLMKSAQDGWLIGINCQLLWHINVSLFAGSMRPTRPVPRPIVHVYVVPHGLLCNWIHSCAIGCL